MVSSFALRFLQRAPCADFSVRTLQLLLPCAYASASSATTRTLNGCHGLGRKAMPAGSSRLLSHSLRCPDVRITVISGQRSLTSHVRSLPPMRPSHRPPPDIL